MPSTWEKLLFWYIPVAASEIHPYAETRLRVTRPYLGKPLRLVSRPVHEGFYELLVDRRGNIDFPLQS